MNWLGKLFGKKKTYPKQDLQLRLCIVDENANLIYETLGISEKRAKEIAAFTLAAYRNHEKRTGSLQEILTHCVHINEFVFSYECYNKIHQLHAQRNSLEEILSIFGD